MFKNWYVEYIHLVKFNLRHRTFSKNDYKKSYKDVITPFNHVLQAFFICSVVLYVIGIYVTTISYLAVLAGIVSWLALIIVTFKFLFALHFWIILKKRLNKKSTFFYLHFFIILFNFLLVTWFFTMSGVVFFDSYIQLEWGYPFIKNFCQAFYTNKTSIWSFIKEVYQLINN